MVKKLCSVIRCISRSLVRSPSSVTRWLGYLFNIWPFTTVKICPISTKLGSKFCQLLNESVIDITKDIENFAKLLKFVKSGLTARFVCVSVHLSLSDWACQHGFRCLIWVNQAEISQPFRLRPKMFLSLRPRVLVWKIFSCYILTLFKNVYLYAQFNTYIQNAYLYII